MSAWATSLLLALAMGVLSSWGVGGGTLLLVCMTLFLGIDHRQAQAMNLLFFLPTAGLGLLFHRKNGFVDRDTAQQAALPAILGSLIGALLATTLNANLLRKPFGIFLLFCGSRVLLSARKKT